MQPGSGFDGGNLAESPEGKGGVSAEKSPLADHGLLISGYDYLEALSAFQKGWIQVQDTSSALVGQAASPCAGDRILDVCGAPGGKSLDMADRLKGTGLVEVRDLTYQKVALIEDNIKRTGAYQYLGKSLGC